VGSVNVFETVVSQGNTAVFQSVFCIGTSTNPPINSLFIKVGSGMGSFNATFGFLLPKTTYFVRAFAINNTDTAFDNEFSIKTIALGLPIISTAEANNLKQTSANSEVV
jgi:hypothetical protein